MKDPAKAWEKQNLQPQIPKKIRTKLPPSNKTRILHRSDKCRILELEDRRPTYYTYIIHTYCTCVLIDSVRRFDKSNFTRMLIVTLLVLCIYWLWSRRRHYALSMKMSGPFAYPIIGNALDIGMPESAFGKFNIQKYNI